MNYWIDLFTGTTWDEFRASGAKISGFSARMRGAKTRVNPGDVLLCYLTGVMRWVGALEVVGPSSDKTRIWKDAAFPVRFEVKALVMLNAENGVLMSALGGRVAFYESAKDRGKFKGFVRMSPNRFKRTEDGDLVMALLREAEAAPVSRPVDARKLARRPFVRTQRKKGREIVETVVSIPEPEEPEEERESGAAPPSTRHTEIQYHLLTLGAEMGLEVWVARNDRNRAWDGRVLGSLPGMVAELPTQFNEATQRTIELIDVLWLKGNSIVAAFEVECTTSVYSGLLRMSDLLSLQPNLEIKLYLVAPDERRAKVKQEIMRPTFAFRDKPVSSVCGFLAFSRLMEKVDGIKRLGLAASLRPEFLEKTAEFFEGSASDD